MSKIKIAIVVGGILLFLFTAVTLSAYGFRDNSNEQKEVLEDAAPISLKEKEQKEVLELTQDRIELEVGAKFDYKQYIKIATDKYGYSVKEKIKVDSELPTNIPGEYQIEYVMDLGNDNHISAPLHVIIKEIK